MCKKNTEQGKTSFSLPKDFTYITFTRETVSGFH